MKTIPEYFERIEHNARINNNFNLEWGTYSAVDFGLTFLPFANKFQNETIFCYDAAELFNAVSSLPKSLLTYKKELFSIRIYSYPITAEANKKKNNIRLNEEEICCFIEVDSEKNIYLSFKFGRSFHRLLNSGLKEENVGHDSGFFEKQVYKTDSKRFVEQLSQSINYEEFMPYILETINLTNTLNKTSSFEKFDDRIEKAYKEGVDGVLFEAGFVKNKSPKSWGHGDIEKTALGANGYQNYEIDVVYFGNWLRDYSSFISGLSIGFRYSDRQKMHIKNPFIDNNLIKEFSPAMPFKITHAAWVEIINIIAVKEFVISKKNNPAQHFDTHLKEFDKFFGEINRDNLGLYRPEEHIDNPKGLNDESILANKMLKDRVFFRYESDRNRFSETTLYPGPFIKYQNKQAVYSSYDVNPESKMKRYIKEDFKDRPSSFTYFKQQLNLAVEYGNSKNGYIHLGAALHVLEDYYAHTNFVEISLIKAGHLNTEPWIQPIPPITSLTTGEELACQIPIVTGVFGLADLVASIVPKLAETILPVKTDDFKNLEPGDRTLFDNLVIVVLEDFVNQEKDDPKKDKNPFRFLQGFTCEDALEYYKYFLKLRDKYLEMKKWAWVIFMPIEEIERLIKEIIDVILYFPKYILKLLLMSTNEVIKSTQTATAFYGTNPSHTQIAKDDPDHPLNPLAGLLAAEAVGEIGRQIKECWNKKKRVKDVVNWANSRYFAHPCDTNWADNQVKEWMNKNPDKLKDVQKSHFPEQVREYLDKLLQFDLNSLKFIKR
jgi:hypothetical protein